MNSGNQFSGAVLVMEAAVATCWRFFSEATVAKIPDPEDPLGFSENDPAGAVALASS
jgi:hypothetical protein